MEDYHAGQAFAHSKFLVNPCPERLYAPAITKNAAKLSLVAMLRFCREYQFYRETMWDRIIHCGMPMIAKAELSLFEKPIPHPRLECLKAIRSRYRK